MAVLLLVFVVGFPLRAQDSKSTSETKPDFSQEPTILDYIHESMRYENDGSGTRELRSRIRIQTTAGLNAAGQLVFQYNALDEEINVRSVRVFRKDGTIAVIGPEAVQDLTAPVTSETPMYTDARQKHITVPGLSVGDVVEYDVVVSAKPVIPGQFWRIWTFTNSAIALDEQLELNVPKDRPVRIKSPEGIEPSISVEGNRRIYHWATSNLKTPPPIDLFQNFRFDVNALLGGNRHVRPPRVLFSTFQSWTEVAVWYAQLERERRNPTNEVRAKANEITRGLRNDEDKAQALYYWVSQNIRYVSLSFGVGRYQPHAATEVLANRYGDCKDKTTLLEAMLEAEGLYAHPVLVSLSADVDPEMPNPMQFDHAIAFLRIADKDIWLDTTLGVGPFGYLVPQLRNTEALVVSETPSLGLRKLPQEFPFAVEYRIVIEGQIDAQGTLNADVELRTRSDLEVLIRLINNRFSQEQFAKSADSVLASTNKFLYGSVQYTNFTVANPADISTPVKARFHATGKPVFIDPKSTRMQLMETITYGLMMQMRDLKLLPSINPNLDATGRSAEFPIELKGPRSYSLNLNLTFADLPKSDIPPTKELHLAEGFAEFQSLDSWENSTFHGFKSLDLRLRSIPASDSNEYEAFVKKLTDAFPAPHEPKKESEATRSSAAKPSEPPVSPAKPLYDAAKRASASGNDATSAQLYEQAVAQDPKYKEAWNDLGYVYGRLGQQEKSEAALRKALALDPSAKYAHYNLGNALTAQKKYDEAISEYQKEIQINSTNSYPHLNLGRAYMLTGQFAKAVPELAIAASISPDDPKAQFQLGRAYANTGQPEKAGQAFKRSVDLEPTAERKNSVAYEMAVSKLQLDQAEKYADSAIEYAVGQTRDVSLNHLSTENARVPSFLGSYWDTLGWVKFQQGNIPDAEKYVRCAWLIRSIGEIGDHLGQIYEKEGNKAEAIELYAMALAAPHPMPETRARLVALRGSDTDVDRLTEEARASLANSHTLQINNAHDASGIAEFWLLLSPGPKVSAVKFIAGDEALRPFSSDLETATFPDPFPETTDAKLLRRGKLTCLSSSKVCSLFLMSAETVHSAD
jgi:tetratricopeptide (TPR) repeat protein